MFDLEYYKKISENKHFLGGVDEVGRGPLAGPVVACSVLLVQKKIDLNEFVEFLETLKVFGINDSKKISRDARLKIIQNFELELISGQELKLNISKNFQMKYFIQEISVDEIDRINILNASLKAMKNSFEGMQSTGGILLIDGNKKFETLKKVSLETVVKGDSKSLVIGLASIIAKEYRDQLMEKLSENYPQYGWIKNAGYGTKMHLQAISDHGITPIHRKTFRGVKEHCESGIIN